MRPIIVGLIGVVAVQVSAQQPNVTGIARPTYTKGESLDSITAKLDRWLVKMSVADSFSGVVAVRKSGARNSYVRAAGMANRRTGEPNSTATRFTLASMGKMFAAVSIAQLIDQHKVALNDTVGKFLADFPNADVRRVTVAQLLNHTSGLGTYFGARYSSQRAALMTLADYVPLFAPDPLQFPPGTRFGYSNAGYLVLGRIVEVVSGMEYYDYVKRNIFDKVGMPNTGHYDRTGTTPNGAVGYYRPPNDPTAPMRENLDQRELRGSSAGGGYSTAADMEAFLDAVFHDRLMSAKTRELFTTAKGDGPFGPNSYGYGFMMRTRGDTVVAIGHTGGFPGMATQAFYYPKSGVTLVVLLNETSPGTNAVMAEAARAAAAIEN
jgi:CubicO group peptidase (beta-lactamase class C family)